MSLKNYNNNINESDVTDDTDSFNKSDSWSKDDKIPEILENINKIKISDPIINNIDTDLLSSIFYSESDNESNEQTNESDEQFDELDKSDESDKSDKSDESDSESSIEYNKLQKGVNQLLVKEIKPVSDEILSNVFYNTYENSETIDRLIESETISISIKSSNQKKHKIYPKIN